VTEAAIISTLIALHKERSQLGAGLTIVSISHHPQTAREADTIIVMEKGKIAETGTYMGLMEQDGQFVALVNGEKPKDQGTDQPLLQTPPSPPSVDSVKLERLRAGSSQ
jgi:ABC-type transport system involved in cytochrome bd biosynthesis fused ATPase/permease subunit